MKPGQHREGYCKDIRRLGNKIKASENVPRLALARGGILGVCFAMTRSVAAIVVQKLNHRVMFHHLSQLVVLRLGLALRRRAVGWSLLLGLALSWVPLFLSGILPSQAVEVGAVVNPRQAHGGWVTDQAELLSSDAEAQLNALLSQLESVNGAEVAVVTVPDVAPSPSPKAFTTELFNAWGIGKEGQDNGVLVMVSRGDRPVPILRGQKRAIAIQ